MVFPKKKLLIKIIFSLVCTLFLWNCDTRGTKNRLNEKGFAEDSIAVWISYGKNDSIPFKKRGQVLEKAYKVILQETNDSLKPYYLSEISLEFFKVRSEEHTSELQSREK